MVFDIAFSAQTIFVQEGQDGHAPLVTAAWLY